MDYDRKLHETYVKGRQLAPETEALWMDAAAEFLRPRPGERPQILDLGSGTGRFSGALARRFGARVVGVEPSDRMRSQAVEANDSPDIRYLPGTAEAIPCPDAHFDAAWLSLVVHHFASIPSACRELARVLRPGGLAFVRSCFSGRLEQIPTYEYWPAAKAIDEKRFPTLEALTADFDAAGFDRIGHREILQPIDASLQAHYERLQLRAVSTFQLMTEDEVQQGFDAMARAIRTRAQDGPVVERIELAVFRRREPT